MVLDITNLGDKFKGRFPKTEDALRKAADIAREEGASDRVSEFPPVDFSFENHVEKIKVEHNSQLESLYESGLVEKEGDRYYIIGDDVERHFAPTSEEVAAIIAERREDYEPKMYQGFRKYQVTPLIDIQRLAGTLGEELVSKYRDRALYRAGTKKATSLNVDQPVWQSNVQSQEPVYFVEQFGKDHKGMTFKELFQKTGGFLVTLEEDRDNLAIKPKTLAGRKQFGINTSAVEAVTKYGEGMNKNEVGMTRHQWLVMALKTLKETGRVLDDIWGKGKAAILSGEYWPNKNLVPFACFGNAYGQVRLGDANPGDGRDHVAPRSSVIIIKK